MKKIIWINSIIIALLFSSSVVYSDRLKDLTSIAGVRNNQLVGYGIVVGLAGTGDGNIGLTLQSMQSMVSRFGIVTDVSGLDAKNTAAVMVTAEMTPFVKPGQQINVTVSTLGKSKSLRGGTLLMTPLLGADGETYAIAQGNMVVGGLGVSGNDGSSVIVNIPTVGTIPRGATVERLIDNPFLTSENIILNLNQGDFSTALAVSESINEIFGPDVSVPLDASSIKIRAPLDPSQKVAFVSLLENIEVEPARPKAKVIINARTGTIVIGGDVRITPAAVTHGKLTVRVNESQNITPTQNVIATDDQIVATPGGAVATPETEADVEEQVARSFVFDPGVELATIVDAINDVGATASDLVAILEALREAGSLRAELIII
ncbi:MAG: flagellar basal body P-ring protein FlgI [Paracoccaceae bacterium]